MSAHVLLEFIKRVEESLFRYKFNKFNKTGA